MSRFEILKKLNDALAQFSFLKVAIVYGSFATGKERPDSDIDLAVAGSQKLTIDQMVEIQTKTSSFTGREIDLIDLNAARGTVFKEALTKGLIILKVDDGLYAQILNRMLLEQADFEVLRSRMLEESRKQVLG